MTTPVRPRLTRLRSFPTQTITALVAATGLLFTSAAGAAAQESPANTQPSTESSTPVTEGQPSIEVLPLDQTTGNQNYSTQAGTATVGSASAPISGTVRLNGKGLSPSKTYEIFLQDATKSSHGSLYRIQGYEVAIGDTGPWAVATTGSTGAFSINVKLPDGTSKGQYGSSPALVAGRYKFQIGGNAWGYFSDAQSLPFSVTANYPAVKGAIGDKWYALGGLNSSLGRPSAVEKGGLKNGGAWQQFQGGKIHWSSRTGAWPTAGAIGNTWASLNWENGKLGYPSSDEKKFSGISYSTYGNGVYQDFQNGKVIWSPKTGAKAAFGAIYDYWYNGAWRNLGYPTTNEFSGGNSGAGQHFQDGSIYWSAKTGPKIVKGAIRDAWAKQGWERSKLGYPTSEEQYNSGYVNGTYRTGVKQTFQGGTLYWWKP